VGGGPAQTWPMLERDEIGYARSGEVAIGYVISGEGPRDLVFAHGLAGDVQIERETDFMRTSHERCAKFASIRSSPSATWATTLERGSLDNLAQVLGLSRRRCYPQPPPPLLVEVPPPVLPEPLPALLMITTPVGVITCQTPPLRLRPCPFASPGIVSAV
jgi:hypothetical protein